MRHTASRRNRTLLLPTLCLALVTSLGVLVAAGPAPASADGADGADGSGSNSGAQRASGRGDQSRADLTHAQWRSSVRPGDLSRPSAARGVYGAVPLLARNFPDPSVHPWPGGYVATGTGPDALRATAPTANGPWTATTPALAYLPSWAIANRAWASDIEVIDGRWLVYFSVEAAGLPENGRCIGVAYATDPTQPFVPLERPLICPKAAVAPKAYDPLKHHPVDIPINGVIDPDLFRDHGGHYYMLYRTQAFPASIRIVPLPKNGLPVGTTERSQELVRSTNTVENPTMVKRKGQYILLTSEDYFAGCSYETTYRRSKDLLDWSGATPKVLLNTAKTGLCGPGGGDLDLTHKNHPVLFFHAWTCPDLGGVACPSGPNYDTSHQYHAIRSMYGVTLRFTKHQAPRIESYLTPAPG